MTKRHFIPGITTLCLSLAVCLQAAASDDNPAGQVPQEESAEYWDWGDPVSPDAPIDTEVSGESDAASPPDNPSSETGIPTSETSAHDTDEAENETASPQDVTSPDGEPPDSDIAASVQDTAADVSESEGSGPASATGEAHEAAVSGETDLGDWDWGEIQEADVTPPQPSASESRRRKDKKREGPRVGATAEPDFERTPLPGQPVFASTPSYAVVPSQKDTDMHPCSDCHEWAESDLTPRSLQDPHDNFTLDHGLHGKGEFWCFTCHDLEGGGGLRTLEGVPLGFDDAYMVCAQCHSQEARDWSYGAHGKRVENWAGERTILNCTVCHYQHRPIIGARAPKPPRPVPSLNNRKHNNAPPRVERIWERYARKNAPEASHGP